MHKLKKLGKNILCRLLESQVRRLRARNDFKVIAVAGSVGKTSTKLAIARTLAAREQVIYQDGNYNDRLTVPLVLFGRSQPGIFNVSAWIMLLLRNELALRRPYPYKIAVLELGTDGPGQLKDFAYLRPDISVITAIAEEHMEYFKTLDAVAAEELTPVNYSKQTLLNIDDVPVEYLPEHEFLGYGFSEAADFHIDGCSDNGLHGQDITVSMQDGKQATFSITQIGPQGAKFTLAAITVTSLLGWTDAEIQDGLQRLVPVPGRMQVLAGRRESILIDDTYNASPIAVKAALDVLYSTDAPQRIAILGTMNELGEGSAEAHRSIGEYCDPAKLDLVVTIGELAEQNLAPEAAARGCRTLSFTSPYEAGMSVVEYLKPGAVVLAKGSQNGVFAEEALKELLAEQNDAAKLVRQSSYWLARKQQQFPEAKSA